MKLPIGVQSFDEIRRGGYYYVDKTKFVKKLADNGKYFFLSRPRRFGKSLFLDTLRCAFEGKRELFEGLFLENNWNWEEKYPVIRFDFSEQKVKSTEELEEFLNFKIKENAKRLGVEIETGRYYYTAFMELITKTAETKKKQVILLIDEYDKPILDNIENREKAKEIREVLKGFYQVIKPADPYLRFVFLTGASKFSKVSLFSGLNNLQDITLHPEYNEICGYTQEEFERIFEDRISEIIDKMGEEVMEEIKLWYNGYRWGGEEKLYNPFDVLLFLSEREFAPFWFETGTPEFLMRIILENRYPVPKLENISVSRIQLDSFDIEKMELEAVLFQTGYLTIKQVRKRSVGLKEYILSYPNFEVKTALTNYILDELTRSPYAKEKSRLWDLMETGDLDGLEELLRQLFAGIPHDWYRKNKIAEYEGYWASVIYSFFSSAGFDVRAEDTTYYGRIDITVLHRNKAYIFEIKVSENERKNKKGKTHNRKTKRSALEQIKEKRYWEKYEEEAEEIYLIGIEFSLKKRNIVRFEWEKF